MWEGEGGRDLKWDKLEASGTGMGYFPECKEMLAYCEAVGCERTVYWNGYQGYF